MTTNDSSSLEESEKHFLPFINGVLYYIFMFLVFLLIGYLSFIKHCFSAVEFKDATWVRYMWWVYIIGLVWSSEFILACQHMIISGAVAKWYFSKCVIHL